LRTRSGIETPKSALVDLIGYIGTPIEIRNKWLFIGTIYLIGLLMWGWTIEAGTAISPAKKLTESRVSEKWWSKVANVFTMAFSNLWPFQVMNQPLWWQLGLLMNSGTSNMQENIILESYSPH